MTRQYVNQLSDAQPVDEVFRAFGKQLRPNRNGNLYLQVQLSDRTGSVVGMLWNAGDRIYRSFQNGDYVQIEGTAQVYNGTIQIIASRIERVESTMIDENEFMLAEICDIDQLNQRLKELLRSVKNVHLRNIVESFLVDDEFMELFSKCPAGIKVHHAYAGGLLEHVVKLIELAEFVGKQYSALNGEMLILGAFLHDIGKVRELTISPDFGYSDEGQLIGHMVIGIRILEDKVREAEELSGEPIPDELVLQLKHMIVSHHGEYEYGSPKLPMTLESIALHYLDSLDAKVQSFTQILQDDPNSDSHWTSYQPNINRKLYKGLDN